MQPWRHYGKIDSIRHVSTCHLTREFSKDACPNLAHAECCQSCHADVTVSFFFQLYLCFYSFIYFIFQKRILIYLNSNPNSNPKLKHIFFVILLMDFPFKKSGRPIQEKRFYRGEKQWPELIPWRLHGPLHGQTHATIFSRQGWVAPGTPFLMTWSQSVPSWVSTGDF